MAMLPFCWRQRCWETVSRVREIRLTLRGGRYSGAACVGSLKVIRQNFGSDKTLDHSILLLLLVLTLIHPGSLPISVLVLWPFFHCSIKSYNIHLTIPLNSSIWNVPLVFQHIFDHIQHLVDHSPICYFLLLHNAHIHQAGFSICSVLPIFADRWTLYLVLLRPWCTA